MDVSNIFSYTIDPEKEQIEELLRQENLRIERIISFGQCSGIYEQSEDEWVLLLEGEARLELATRTGPEEDLNQHIELRAGSMLFLPAGLRHRVSRTSKPALWLCVFVPGKAPADS